MRKLLIPIFALWGLLLLAGPVLAQDGAPLTLNEAILLTTSKSGDAQAQDEVDRSRAVVQKAHASRTVSLSAGLTDAPQPGAQSQLTLSGQVVVAGGSQQTRLGQLRVSQAATAQAVASLATTKRALVQSVIAAFFAVASDQMLSAAARDNESLVQRSLTAAQERHQFGIAPLLDVERAQAALSTAQAERFATTSALILDRRALAMLLDVPEVSAVALPPAVMSTSDVAVLAKDNPAIAASAATLSLAQASLLQARGLQVPDLSFGLGAQLTRQGPSQSVGPAASVTINVPLGASLLHANVAAAQANVSAARVALDQSQRSAIQSALQSQSRAESSIIRLRSLQTAADQARKIVENMLAGYRIGAVSSADLINAQTQFVAARSALNAATLQAAQSAATFQLEIGALTR